MYGGSQSHEIVGGGGAKLDGIRSVKSRVGQLPDVWARSEGDMISMSSTDSMDLATSIGRHYWCRKLV